MGGYWIQVMVKKYIEYKDRDENGVVHIVSGIYEVIEEGKSCPKCGRKGFIRVKTKHNIILIPFDKIEKIKESIEH